jgi:hypothetical protein
MYVLKYHYIYKYKFTRYFAKQYLLFGSNVTARLYVSRFQDAFTYVQNINKKSKNQKQIRFTKMDRNRPSQAPPNVHTTYILWIWLICRYTYICKQGPGGVAQWTSHPPQEQKTLVRSHDFVDILPNSQIHKDMTLSSSCSILKKINFYNGRIRSQSLIYTYVQGVISQWKD